MPRLVVIGSANVDFTVRVPRLPRPGETVSNGTLLVNFGGKGANQAVAARRLGADVRFIGCVGDDASGREVVAALEREGIDVAGVRSTPGAATGTALIVVDGEGRNQIAVAPGANRSLSVEHAQACRDAFAWAEVVVTQLEIPVETVRWGLEEARAHGAITVLNPAPVPDVGLDAEMYTLVDYLTPNEGEAERLSGERVGDVEGARRAARVLLDRGAGTVIVTLGESGALSCSKVGTTLSPAYRVTVVDTTAAGDAFNAALALALAERRPLDAALAFANAAGALACTRPGAQPALPTTEEVRRLVLDRRSPDWRVASS